MSLVPTFDIEFDTAIADSRRVERSPMTFLHMSHRFGPVTTARLLAGDTVERYNRTKVRIVGMTLQETDRRQEPAL